MVYTSCIPVHVPTYLQSYAYSHMSTSLSFLPHLTQSHAHLPLPLSPTPTHSHPPTFTPTHLAMAMKQAKISHIHFQLTSSQPSSPWWLVSLPHPLSTSLSLWKPYSSIFLPPVKWPSSLQVLLGRSRTGRFISVSHQCFQLGLKVGPLAALCTVAIDTTGDIILLEGGYLGSAL